MFCGKGRCNVNSCPAYYDEDYWDVYEEAEQTPRSGRSHFRAGQDCGAIVSNIQTTQQFLDSLRNLHTLTQNLIFAFDQVSVDGRNQNQSCNGNPYQVPSGWSAGIQKPYQVSPYPANCYPPNAYSPNPYPPSAYPPNTYAPRTHVTVPSCDDPTYKRPRTVPPETSRSYQGCESTDSDYITINVPVMLEVNFNGKEAEITKVMHITESGSPTLSQRWPEESSEMVCGEEQQTNYCQTEPSALSQGIPEPPPDPSCPPERQRDYSRPLPKPQQKDVKRCVTCSCDECPVYFTDSDTPGCPNDCGCCDCAIKFSKIREAQKKIKTCKCTGVAGPCKCEPSELPMGKCNCMKLAEEFLDALDERSVLCRPDVKKLEKPEVTSKEPDKNVPIQPDKVKTKFVKCPEECPPDCVKCAEKKKNISEPNKESQQVKPDENVAIPPDKVKIEFVKCPEECPPDCIKCGEEKKHSNEPKNESEDDKPDETVPIPQDNVKTEVFKCPEECPPDYNKCAENKTDLNEPKNDSEDVKPDENVSIPTENVKIEFVKCPEECPPDCIECAEKINSIDEAKEVEEVPIPPDNVKTEFVKCPEECPSDCIQCAEKKENLNEPKKELEEANETKDTDKKEDTKDEICAAVEQNEEVKGKEAGKSIFGHQIPPNCLQFFQCLYEEMAKLEEAKNLEAPKKQQKQERSEDEQGNDEKQRKERQEKNKILEEEEVTEEKPEIDEEVRIKEEPKEEIDNLEVKEELVKEEKENPQKEEELQKEEQPQKKEEQPQKKEEQPQKKEEPVKEEKVDKEPDKREEVTKQEEKVVEDSEQAEKPDDEQEKKELKEEKYIKEDRNKKKKNESEEGASGKEGEKKDDESKTLSPASKKKTETEVKKGCMCHAQKQNQQQVQRPASFLLELSADINKILTKKLHKLKTCCCDDKFNYPSEADQRRTDMTSRIGTKVCSDQPDIGDIYVATRARQNQVEASQDSRPCCNKRSSYGYSLDKQLKEFEDKKVNSLEVLKMFVEDISKDIKAMRSTLNRGLYGRRFARSRFSNSDRPEYCTDSFPASIRSVRPLGSKALLITWVVHSFCGLAGYEIWVDDHCKTRLHASGYDSGCVYSVDVTKRHVIALHPIPTEDCLRTHKANAERFMCKIFPNFSEPKPKLKRPPLPEPWTPSIYIYDPTCPSADSNFSIDEGPCCCV